MKKILLLTRYSRKGASTRLRTLQYVPYLQAHGFDVQVEELFDDHYLDEINGGNDRSIYRVIRLYARRLLALRSAVTADLVWMEKEVFPQLPAFAERFAALAGVKYVVDYDDAVFLNYSDSRNFFVRKLLGRKIDTVMRHASCVIAGNGYLADYARGVGATHIKCIPTVVDHTRYFPRAAGAGARPVIGWMGSPSTQKYVLAIRDSLAEVCAEFDARLVLVGAYPHVPPEFGSLRPEILPWTEATEAENVRAMDVGIMPLPDGPWERGKCGYKLIQYMACGVPVVASPVGVNPEIVEGSGSGLLAGSGAEWTAALRRLLSSPEERLRLGAAGRHAVERTYSLQVQAPALCNIFRSVIEGEA